MNNLLRFLLIRVLIVHSGAGSEGEERKKTNHVLIKDLYRAGNFVAVV